MKNSLGGNTFTVLVVNLSPSAKDHRETLSSLEYAKRAKRIQNTISQNAGDCFLEDEGNQSKTPSALFDKLQADMSREKEATLVCWDKPDVITVDIAFSLDCTGSMSV